MKYEIRNRWDGKIIYQDEAESFSDLVRAAVKSGADLSGADLSGADLSGAYLSRADLSWADLSGADLSGAYLSRADLSWANLSRADLSRADLSRANLSRANLSRANLSRAYLSWADLSRANLSWANLSRANLSGADLSRANLYGYYSFGPGGSRSSYTWARWEPEGYMVHCGCQTLTLKDFAGAVKKKHGSNYHGKWYSAHIEVMKLVARESKVAYKKSRQEESHG